MVLSFFIIILILDDASAFTIYTKSKASKSNFNYINVVVYTINSGFLLNCEKFHIREIIKASLSRDLSIIFALSMQPRGYTSSSSSLTKRFIS